MTNKEAIEHLRELKTLRIEFLNTLQEQALDLAIKALEDVERLEVKFDKEQLQEIVDKAKAEVLASVKRPQGKKIKKRHYGWVYCSECDSLLGQQDKFCWNCGAKMR